MHDISRDPLAELEKRPRLVMKPELVHLAIFRGRMTAVVKVYDYFRERYGSHASFTFTAFHVKEDESHAELEVRLHDMEPEQFTAAVAKAQNVTGFAGSVYVTDSHEQARLHEEAEEAARAEEEWDGRNPFGSGYGFGV